MIGTRRRFFVPAAILGMMILWFLRENRHSHSEKEATKRPLETVVRLHEANADSRIHTFVFPVAPTRIATPKATPERQSYYDKNAKKSGQLNHNLKNQFDPQQAPDDGNKNGFNAGVAKLGQSTTLPDNVDWSRFAYAQYVTNEDYLQNSVMIFETLHRLGSRADRLMLYPVEMLDPKATAAESRAGSLLVKARDEYGVKLKPIKIQRRNSVDMTWADSFTKLLAFNQTEYDRVLSLDSDGTILQDMDELFLIPPCPVAMPRAYWLLADNPDRQVLSSQVVLVQPDIAEFERVLERIHSAKSNDYDMEILNDLYRDSATVLPHRRYDVLTGEWRRSNHSHYLGSDREIWDPVEALNEAKYVHFSDWPVPKPWHHMPGSLREEHQPECSLTNGEENCVQRDIWNNFYAEFAERRQKICAV